MPCPAHDPAAKARRARHLATGFLLLVALTFGLIVLGALVRAHGAGLACPDWPLCSGQLVPAFNLKVAFEWSHRATASLVLVSFTALALLTLRNPTTRTAAGRLLPLASVALLAQALLGALTVWLRLAEWTVTAHLVVGNTFNACALLLALRLQEAAQPRERSPVPAAARLVVTLCAALLGFQLVLGGMVSSSFAGLACPEWPSCNGGQWFPTWHGSVGVHLVHRLNGYLLTLSLAGACLAARPLPRLFRMLGGALALVLGQLAVGVANVLLGIPVEITALHSALAAALVLMLAAASHEAWAAPLAPEGANAVLQPGAVEEPRG